MFMGNPKLRSGGERIRYTRNQIEEIKHCIESPEYFIENYVQILSLDSERLVNFEMRPYQRRMLQTIHENRFTVCRFPRQSGKTITAAAIALWYALFNSNYPILIVANKHDRARAILNSVQKMYEHVPLWLQQGIKRWAKGSVEFENGSVIHTAGTSGSAGRGGAYAMVIVDEVAFIPTHIAKDFFESVIPTISSGKKTKIIATSTPKGLNHFYKLYSDAAAGKNGYVPLEIKWNEVPGRDEAFRKQIIDAYGETYFNQEFGAEFLGSSFTLISASKLVELTPQRPLHVGANINVYKDPLPGHTYILTSDVSEGVMGDYSIAMVFDVTITPFEIVAIYRNNKISTMLLPNILMNMARTFNNALVMVETTGIGQEVANILMIDLEYENVGMTKSNTLVGQVFGGEFMEKSRIGLRMDKRTKAIGCGKLKALIEGNQLPIPDKDMIDELRCFSAKGKSYEAEDGHDDLVMCGVIFAWMADQGYFRELTGGASASEIARQNMQHIEDQLTPVLHWQDPPNAPIIAQRKIIVNGKEVIDEDSWIWREDTAVPIDPPIIKLW